MVKSVRLLVHTSTIASIEGDSDRWHTYTIVDYIDCHPRIYVVSDNNNDNDRLTAFDPGQPG